MAGKRRKDAIDYDRKLAQRYLDEALRSTRTIDQFRAGDRRVPDQMLVAREIASRAEGRLGRLARNLARDLDGDAPSRRDLAGFSAEARRIIAASHLAAIRVYTDRTPTERDKGRLDARVREQFRYFDRYLKVSGGEPLEGRFVARARLYGAAVWTTSQNLVVDMRADEGFTFYRAFLSVAEHCPGCIDRAEMGWVEIGSLTPLGEAECRVRCQCYFLFRRGETVYDAESPD